MIFSTVGKKNIGAPKVKMFLMLSICPSFQYCDSNVQLLSIAPYKVSIFNIVHGFFSFFAPSIRLAVLTTVTAMFSLFLVSKS